MPGCPACGGSADAPFFEMPAAPVLCNILCRTRAGALGVPRAPIRLALCGACGLIFNEAFDPSLITYEGAYENPLHFSGVFREHERRLIRRLVDAFQIRHTTVVEIGCGDGHFLSAVCEAGANTGLGFDPAFDVDRHSSMVGPAVEVRAERFNPAALPTAGVGCVCCRHVLEHIPEPASLLQELRAVLGEDGDALVYFEVPSAMHNLMRSGYWDVIYEHCTYFTPRSLELLFVRCGFEPIETREIYGGQFIGLFARPGEPGEGRLAPEAAADLRALAERFGEGFSSAVCDWDRRLAAHGDGSVSIWGAGSKGVTFLNALSGAERVRCAADVNPRKHGGFIVGTGHEIVGPRRLAELDPDLVIAMNPAYTDEIARELGASGARASVLPSG